MKTYSEYRAEAREALSGKWGEVALLSLVFVVISALITGATSAGSIVAQFGTIFTQMANITGLTFIGLIATFFVALPMQMGYQVIFLKVFRREGIDNYISSMFKIGYKSLGNVIVCSILLMLIVFAVTIVWTIIFAILLAIGVSLDGMSLSSFDLSLDSSALADTMGAATIFFLVLSLALYVFVVLWLSYIYKFTWFVMADHPELSAVDCMRESRKLTEGKRWRLFVLDLSFIGWVLLVIITGGIAALWVDPYIKTTVGAFYQDCLPVPEPQGAATETTESPFAAPAANPIFTFNQEPADNKAEVDNSDIEQ